MSGETIVNAARVAFHHGRASEQNRYTDRYRRLWFMRAEYTRSGRNCRLVLTRGGEAVKVWASTPSEGSEHWQKAKEWIDALSEDV